MRSLEATVRGDRFPRIPTHHLSDGEAPERRFRLLEGVRRELRSRRYSVKTERAYVLWIRRYVLFHDRRHPRDLDVRAVSAYLSHLATEERVAASTQNQALAALRFLYDVALKQPLPYVEDIAPARRSAYVPVVLSQREVRALLAELPVPVDLCAALMYGGGLRVAALRLQPSKSLEEVHHSRSSNTGSPPFSPASRQRATAGWRRDSGPG